MPTFKITEGPDNGYQIFKDGVWVADVASKEVAELFAASLDMVSALRQVKIVCRRALQGVPGQETSDARD